MDTIGIFNKIQKNYDTILYLSDMLIIFNGQYDPVGTPYYITAYFDDCHNLVLTDDKYVFNMFHSEYNASTFAEFGVYNLEHGYDNYGAVRFVVPTDKFTYRDIDDMFDYIMSYVETNSDSIVQKNWGNQPIVPLPIFSYTQPIHPRLAHRAIVADFDEANKTFNSLACGVSLFSIISSL